jgi:hypothetical protein
LSIGPCPYPDLPDMRLWRLPDPRGHSLNRHAGPGGSQGMSKEVMERGQEGRRKK